MRSFFGSFTLWAVKTVECICVLAQSSSLFQNNLHLKQDLTRKHSFYGIFTSKNDIKYPVEALMA